MAVLCISPLPVRAAPREATLFPDAAQVLETSPVPLLPEGADLVKAVFLLPGQADPRSLVVRLAPEFRLKIEDLQYRQTVRQDDLKLRDLRRQTETLREERNALQAARHALENQLQFWQLQTKAKVKTLAEAANTAAAIGKNIKKTYQEKLARETELEKLDRKLKELQDEAKRAAETKETAWEFTLLFSGPRTGQAMLTYTYLLSGCGWTPRYRLEAQPGAKRILVGTEARMWQNSGQDWNDVDISLATVTIPAHGANTEPPAWIIKPRRDAKSGAAPQVWKAGKRNLASGSPQLVRLRESFWSADFVYLVKPAAATQAMLRASLNPPASEEIIPGKAVLTIEGSVFGANDYTLTGRENVIHFGPDPLVRATRRLVREQVDDTAPAKGRKISRWTRHVEILNARTSPARLEVEEPCPRPGDDRIRLTWESEPETTTENSSTLVWNIDLDAGEKKSLRTTVTIDAPGNMELAPF